MSDNKKKYSVCFFLSFLVFLNSCKTIQPVEVLNVENVKLQDVFTKPSVHFDVNIHNPNNFGLTLSEFKSTAFLGDKKVTEIFLDKKVKISNNSSIAIPFQTSPSFNEISSLLLSGNLKGEIKIDGYLVVKKFIFRKKFPFTVKTKL